MYLDTERCLRAVRSRDPRFDGWFVTAVRSTGIYCRPSCPAIVSREDNLRFLPSAAAAQSAGFRACKRCRPDATPGSPEWDHRADLTARAMRLIADGAVDRDGVAGLANQLGYSTRQLERQLLTEVGATPLALARAQRSQTARILLETTRLGIAEVAFGAGFGSVRSFNDTIRMIFGSTPTQLRRRADGAGTVTSTSGALALRLAHRRPLDADALFGHLEEAAIAGIEEWRDGAYRRTLRLPHGPGVVALRPEGDHVACRLRLSDVRDLPAAIGRCRRLLDLDADPPAVDEVLAADPVLEPWVRAAPGRRVVRTVDGAELAVRAVLGQQVATTAARTHARRLVEAHGEPLDDPDGGLTHLFPDAATLAEADLTSLAMPATRRRALTTLAASLAGGELDLGPGGDRDRARARLAEMAGIGPWTTEIVAMRALGDPDAFPATDLALRRAARHLELGDSAESLRHRAELWRPWRAYAAQHLLDVGARNRERPPEARAPATPDTARAPATPDTRPAA